MVSHDPRFDRRTATGPTALPAARFALAAAGAMLALLGIAHVANPDLDPSWRPISEYALGTYGWLMTAAFLAWGLSAFAVFVALQPHVRTLGGKIGLVFLLMGAAGPILAAIFPMDPITTAPEAMTTSGGLHNLGAVLGDGIPIGAALITWSLARHNPAWSAARGALTGATVLAWLGVVMFTASMAIFLSQTEGQLGPDTPIGWPNRFMVAASAAWLLTAAWSSLRIGSRDS